MSFVPTISMWCTVILNSLLLFNLVSCYYYNVNRFNFNQPKDITGKTPCCVDRLTSLTCTRILNTNPTRFYKRCENDPDFGLIQCCSVCFDRKKADSETRYNIMIRRHLEDPIKSTCVDRRGSIWCQKMSKQDEYWHDTRYNTFWGCGAFPSAFRECRNTCGYCSASMQLTTVKYDYNTATNPKRCDIKTYFARTDEEMKKRSKKRKEFDPLARLSWKKPKDNDYFVVEEHNYDEFL